MPEDGETVNKIEKAEEVTERLRREPYNLLGNDCITKSVRFKHECEKPGIHAHGVACKRVSLTPYSTVSPGFLQRRQRTTAVNNTAITAKYVSNWAMVISPFCSKTTL